MPVTAEEVTGPEPPTPVRRPRSWAHREAMAYRSRRRLYSSATNALVAWLQARLEDVDEVEAVVTGRTKDVRSVEQKLRARERSQPGRDTGFADLPDLIGVRVVVRLESEIAIVARELHRILAVDKDVDVRDERGREQTPGYRGRHFDVRALPGADLPDLLRTSTAEIQVRTRAADLWASIEHELRYKSRVELPPARSRQFVLAASLLELAERELEDLLTWHLERSTGRRSSEAEPAAAAVAAAAGLDQAGQDQGGPDQAGLDQSQLARMLAERYPQAAPSTPRRLGWMLELLQEMRLDTEPALGQALPAQPDPRILALAAGRSTVDTVRMLDDQLLLVRPEAFLRANRAVPDPRNPHRLQTLHRRGRRLQPGPS